jgi:uncharacterized membrane protein YdfJ with MMPL/SSD domain
VRARGAPHRGHPRVAAAQPPIVLYLFVLAIGTDYNILVIARLREEARAGNEPRAAGPGIRPGTGRVELIR